MWIALMVVVLLLAGGVWWLHQSLGSVLASSVREYGPRVLGVTVKLGKVAIHPASGMVTIRGLRLGNPKGFRTKEALAVAMISLKLDVASLAKPVIVVHEIWLKQPDITYEYASDGSNLEVIQRYVEAYIAGTAGGEKPVNQPGSEKKLIIGDLHIRGGCVKLSADMLKGRALSVALPDIHLTDLGKAVGGATPAEVARQVSTAITQSTRQAVAPFNIGGAVVDAARGMAAAAEAVKGLFK